MTMTYYSSTIGATGSTSVNTPLLLYATIAGKVPYPGDLVTTNRGGKVWFYSSTNAPADVGGAGVITDGGLLGMMPGDLLMGVVNGGSATTDCYPYLGILNSTQSSLSTAAYNITSNYTT